MSEIPQCARIAGDFTHTHTCNTSNRLNSRHLWVVITNPQKKERGPWHFMVVPRFNQHFVTPHLL